MEITTTDPYSITSVPEKMNFVQEVVNPPVINGIERIWVAIRVRFRILFIALHCYGSVSKAMTAVRGLIKFRRTVYGKKQIRRCVKVDGRYYFGVYLPAFPSRVFNKYVQTELNNILPHKKKVNRLMVVQLAITSKCPLKCEHCFEWNNLNKEEAFTIDQLITLVNKFQEAGCAQFHLTGGEPLVKMNELMELVQTSGHSSEFYILTSGLNCTAENARKLKKAGVTGVVVSLDHFDPQLHNIFRGSEHAFTGAVNAVKNARHAGLVTAFSVCVTRSFCTKENLFQYAKLAKECGVAFVQLLEPKPVGHYEGKMVELSEAQISVLSEFYLTINFDKAYKNYPVFLYHGFHQRKLGCLSGGDRILYVNSAGFIDACPFCQTKSYDAHDIVSGKLKIMDLNVGGCPAYKNKNS